MKHAIVCMLPALALVLACKDSEFIGSQQQKQNDTGASTDDIRQLQYDAFHEVQDGSKIDVDGDGKPDGHLFDKDKDGNPDRVDVDGDGEDDGIGVDLNQDEKPDGTLIDDDDDGRYDGIDINNDEKIDIPFKNKSTTNDGDESDGSDSDENGTKDAKNSTGRDGDETDNDGDIDSDGDSTKPTGLEVDGGELKALPDYGKCAKLPTRGKTGYGRCPKKQALVIINDGKAREQTCCPLSGKNIFSTRSKDLYVKRQGYCKKNEIGVGMIDPHTSHLYCSKINSKYLKLSKKIPAKYVRHDREVNAEMREIAGSYNINDTCICPKGSFAIGGHTARDNRCTDQCVEVIKK